MEKIQRRQGQSDAGTPTANEPSATRRPTALHAERRSAARQISRSLQAWRSEAEGAESEHAAETEATTSERGGGASAEPSSGGTIAASVVARKLHRAPSGTFNVDAAKPQVETQMRFYIRNFGLSGIDRTGDQYVVGSRIVNAVNSASRSLTSAWFRTLREGRVSEIAGLASATTQQRNQLVAYAAQKLGDIEAEIVEAELARLRLPPTSYARSPQGQTGTLQFFGRQGRR